MSDFKLYFYGDVKFFKIKKTFNYFMATLDLNEMIKLFFKFLI